MKSRVDLEILLHELEDRLKTRELELAACPEGRLYQNRYPDRRVFFQAWTGEEGQCIRRSLQKKPDVAVALTRKAYLQAEIALLREDIAILERMRRLTRRYVEPNAENVMARLEKRYRELPEAWLLGAKTGEPEDEVDRWAQAAFKQSDYLPEKRTKCTSRGLHVRTMAEVVWAERLYHHGVAFRYEQILEIGGYAFCPDFTVKRRSDGKLWYIEHCGMTHDAEYLKKHKWKMEMYEQAGIVPWDNLIVTYGDQDGNVDVRVIESEILNKLI